MPATLNSPSSFDDVFITAGGSVTVTSSYNFGSASKLQSFVGTFTDGGVSLSGTGTHDAAVGVNVAGVYDVRIEVDGVEAGRSKSVSVTIG